MPDVFHTLSNYDLLMLKIIARKWDIVLVTTDQSEAALELAGKIKDPSEIHRIIEALPNEASACFYTIAGVGGRLLWSEFIRRYGGIREMGIARRSREAPFESPGSLSEVLWYHGLIGRAFLKGEEELQEYAFIPDEILKFSPSKEIPQSDVSTIVADTASLQRIYTASDRILDYLTSYLAAVRSNKPSDILLGEFKQPSLRECEQLLISCGLIDDKGIPVPEEIKSFLATSRAEVLSIIFSKWLSSTSFNELKLMPGIIAEGLWKNDPFKTRKILVERIVSLGSASWWKINGFINSIKHTLPYYQRPAGDFESWMIRSEKTGASLRGFANWDHVDGALIHFLICGPLHWLGFLDLAGARKGGLPEAFRLSPMAANLMMNKAPEGLMNETGLITALRSGKLICPRDVARAARYQLARFCEWGGMNEGGYIYQISVASLKNAIAQGLQADQLTSLLLRYTGGAMPASLRIALQRWEKYGSQVVLEQVVLFRVENPEILMEIRKSPIGRFLAEPLNSTTTLLPAAAVGKVILRMMELGYICEHNNNALTIHKDQG